MHFSLFAINRLLFHFSALIFLPGCVVQSPTFSFNRLSYLSALDVTSIKCYMTCLLGRFERLISFEFNFIAHHSIADEKLYEKLCERNSIRVRICPQNPGETTHVSWDGADARSWFQVILGGRNVGSHRPSFESCVPFPESRRTVSSKSQVFLETPPQCGNCALNSLTHYNVLN